MSHPRNIVGRQIKFLREKRGMTQPMLVAKLNLLGWDISRETLAKIETHIRWVADCELLCLAVALQVSVETLLPDKDQARKVIRDFIKA